MEQSNDLCNDIQFLFWDAQPLVECMDEFATNILPRRFEKVVKWSSNNLLSYIRQRLIMDRKFQTFSLSRKLVSDCEVLAASILVGDDGIDAGKTPGETKGK